MTTITMTQMNSGKQKTFEFNTNKKAISFFRELCDLYNLDYDNDTTSAGGIGHDYRIEIELN